MFGIAALFYLPFFVVLAPINYGVKFFDADYYRYKAMCMSYPALTIHDKSLYKAYISQNKNLRKYNKQIKKFNKQIKKFNKPIYKHNEMVRAIKTITSSLIYTLIDDTIYIYSYAYSYPLEDEARFIWHAMQAGGWSPAYLSYGEYRKRWHYSEIFIDAMGIASSIADEATLNAIVIEWQQIWHNKTTQEKFAYLDSQNMLSEYDKQNYIPECLKKQDCFPEKEGRERFTYHLQRTYADRKAEELLQKSMFQTIPYYKHYPLRKLKNENYSWAYCSDNNQYIKEKHQKRLSNNGTKVGVGCRELKRNNDDALVATFLRFGYSHKTFWIYPPADSGPGGADFSERDFRCPGRLKEFIFYRKKFLW